MHHSGGDESGGYLPPPDTAAGGAPVPASAPTEEPLLITPEMYAAPVTDARVDFERGMRYTPRATLWLLAVLAVVFGWQLATGALDSQEAIVAAGALERERVLAGDLWRLASAAFLHGGVDHLIGNCISLYILGMAAEHSLGHRGMLTAYAVSAIGGSVLSLVVSPGPSVGASGAIFGLMGAVVVVLHRCRNLVFVRDGRIGVVIAAWAGYTLLTGAFVPMIDNAAHLGGLVAGALAGATLPVTLPRRTS